MAEAPDTLRQAWKMIRQHQQRISNYRRDHREHEAEARGALGQIFAPSPGDEFEARVTFGCRCSCIEKEQHSRGCLEALLAFYGLDEKTLQPTYALRPGWVEAFRRLGYEGLRREEAKSEADVYRPQSVEIVPPPQLKHRSVTKAFMVKVPLYIYGVKPKPFVPFVHVPGARFKGDYLFGLKGSFYWAGHFSAPDVVPDWLTPAMADLISGIELPMSNKPFWWERPI